MLKVPCWQRLLASYIITKAHYDKANKPRLMKDGHARNIKENGGGVFLFGGRNHDSENPEQIWQMAAFPDSHHYERPRVGGPPTNRPPWLLHRVRGRECRGRGDPYQGRLLAPLSALKPSSTCRVRIMTQCQENFPAKCCGCLGLSAIDNSIIYGLNKTVSDPFYRKIGFDINGRLFRHYWNQKWF